MNIPSPKVSSSKSNSILHITSENVESSVGNSALFGMGGYNPLSDDQPSMEIDDYMNKSNDLEDNLSEEDLKKDLKEDFSNSKDKLKEGFSAAKDKFNDVKQSNVVQKAKEMAIKTKDFTKSSLTKINHLPEEAIQKGVNERIAKAKGEPKEFSNFIRDGVKGAGKAAVVGGLAIVSLPLAVAAFIGFHKDNKNKIKAGAEEVRREMIKLDMEIKKAENEGDLDKVADLLVLKRNSERAYNRLKYKADIVIGKNGDD